jgi:hypothetical protein
VLWTLTLDWTRLRDDNRRWKSLERQVQREKLPPWYVPEKRRRDIRHGSAWSLRFASGTLWDGQIPRICGLRTSGLRQVNLDGQKGRVRTRLA